MEKLHKVMLLLVGGYHIQLNLFGLALDKNIVKITAQVLIVTFSAIIFDFD